MRFDSRVPVLFCWFTRIIFELQLALTTSMFHGEIEI